MKICRSHRAVFILVAVLALASAGASQTIHEPAKGSVERKVILDSLRTPIERDLNQKLVFATDHFTVSGNWAFVSGAPRRLGGGRPVYSGTRYKDAIDAGAFDNNFFALLKRSSGKWRVVKYAIGCTDVCYMDWPRTYHAPRSIFPLGE